MLFVTIPTSDTPQSDENVQIRYRTLSQCVQTCGIFLPLIVIQTLPAQGTSSACMDCAMAKFLRVFGIDCRLYPGDKGVRKKGLCWRPLIGILVQALEQEVLQLPRHGALSWHGDLLLQNLDCADQSHHVGFGVIEIEKTCYLIPPPDNYCMEADFRKILPGAGLAGDDCCLQNFPWCCSFSCMLPARNQ